MDDREKFYNQVCEVLNGQLKELKKQSHKDKNVKIMFDQTTWVKGQIDYLYENKEFFEELEIYNKNGFYKNNKVKVIRS